MPAERRISNRSSKYHRRGKDDSRRRRNVISAQSAIFAASSGKLKRPSVRQLGVGMASAMPRRRRAMAIAGGGMREAHAVIAGLPEAA